MLLALPDWPPKARYCRLLVFHTCFSPGYTLTVDGGWSEPVLTAATIASAFNIHFHFLKTSELRHRIRLNTALSPQPAFLTL